MNNPFEQINDRLLNIEGLLINLQSKETPQPGKNEKPITQTELCEFLSITPQTVIRWKKKGKIPFFRIGTAIRFNLDEVLKSLGK